VAKYFTHLANMGNTVMLVLNLKVDTGIKRKGRD